MQDNIFIIEKPMPLIPLDNPISLAAARRVSKSKESLPGFTPLYAQGSLNINVKRFFTDANGAVVDKNTVPNALKVSYPVFLLGNFDRIGGYNIGQKTIRMPVGIPFLMSYVNGYSNPFLYNTGFNDVINNFKVGDIVTVFTDDLNNPNFYVFIVQTCDYGSIASVISNTQTQQQDGVIGQLHVKNIAYQVDQENQISETWQMIAIDNLGQFKQNPFVPVMYKQPLYKLNDFILLPISFLMTQFTAINFLMQFESDNITINLRIAK
jgi:hypothetical protein